jgi:hypothetical protein
LQKPELKAQAEKLQNIGKRLKFALQEKQEVRIQKTITSEYEIH